ncbi:MAG: hypothetical protein LUE87_12940, partial [Lachnospiraceae bacterium]|nr:hypothetical protein [Lachnospiraceae bacterium]
MAEKVMMKDVSMEALALYLDGKRDPGAFKQEEWEILSQIEDGTEIVFEEKEYLLPGTLFIKQPLTLTGNGAHLKGDGADFGIMVLCGNVKISNFVMTDIPYLLEIDPYGAVCEHVTVEYIDAEVGANGIQVGSSRSGGIVRDIHISHCTFHGKDAWGDTGLEANLLITVYAAVGRNDGTEQVNDCLAEDIYIEDNVCKGSYRTAINITSAMAAEFQLTEYKGTYHNNTVKDIHILRNHVDCAWD